MFRRESIFMNNDSENAKNKHAAKSKYTIRYTMYHKESLFLFCSFVSTEEIFENEMEGN